MTIRHALRLFALLALLIVTACGLSNEPQIISTQRPTTAAPTPLPERGEPPARVSLARGREVFTSAQGCALCHGIGGAWDGPSAPAFTCQPMLNTPETREETIRVWYDIVTNGNRGEVNCLMPPWRNRFDEQTRWDVTSYSYALHYTSEQLTSGKAIWAAQCASCHGENGTGIAEKNTPNFADPAYLIDKSDMQLVGAITQGIPSLENHAFTSLSEADRWAVIAYLRAQTWQDWEILLSDSVAPAATEDAAPTQAATAVPTPSITGTPVAVAPEVTTAANATITVRGKSADSGVALPEGADIKLRVIQPSSGTPQILGEYDAKVAADGSYTFANVVRQVGAVYILSTRFSQVSQFSEPLILPAEAGQIVDLPITVYEVTNDPSVLAVEVQRIFVDVLSENRALIQVALRIRNVDRRMYVSDQTAPTGNRITMEFQLPPGASSIRLVPELQGQFFVFDDGSPMPRILGFAPLAPGTEGIVQYSYELPINEAQVLVSEPNRYAIAELTVNVPQTARAKINDANFTLGAPVPLQTGIYDTYSLNAGLPANAGLRFSVVFEAFVPQTNFLAIGIAIVGVVLLILGTVFVLRRRGQAEPTEKTSDESPVEGILRQIAALDDQFARGEIEESAYRTERDHLKAKAAKLLQESKE
ncbi:MAG: hypothetical protein OHK0023_06260 [Anaerolineae bacterium]